MASKILLILLFCIGTLAYGQRHSKSVDTANYLGKYDTSRLIIRGRKDTIIIDSSNVKTGKGSKPEGKIYFGLAGIRKSEPIDTQKLYFHKFVYFTEQMNKTTGRTSARYQDSVERYYKLLYAGTRLNK